MAWKTVRVIVETKVPMNWSSGEWQLQDLVLAAIKEKNPPKDFWRGAIKVKRFSGFTKAFTTTMPEAKKFRVAMATIAKAFQDLDQRLRLK